ncbi:MAG TPA: helix-turn-helix transcriptional regulator [Candidatus Caccousia avistercoris]|nr:helix-turn-helix transcriptional regulator [Candidatus Caccousia avistercoris]
MEARLSQTIRALRRERRLTQEQLAEAMGVTVGAVSKWESGACTPEISLLMELADFFETSVDALLGFQQQSGGLKGSIERLHRLRDARDYNAARHEAEKTLQKYPNSFEAVYECAFFFHVMGMEQQDKAALRRCQQLYRRALELFPQNQKAGVSRDSLYSAIASAFLSLGEEEQGLELLRQNNVEGRNDGLIGSTLACHLRRYDEALPSLSNAMLRMLAGLIQVSFGYANAFLGKGEPGQALALTTLVMDFLQGFQKPGRISLLDKMSAALWGACALCCEKLGRRESMREYLRRAAAQARRFDAAPNSSVSELRFIFVEGEATGFDDFGRTAWEGVDRLVRENAEEYPAAAAYWEEMKHEEEG